MLLLVRRNKLDKTHKPCRVIYTALESKCPICIELHNKSKVFGTPYHLLYHLRDHNSDDETTTKITVKEIRNTVKQICIAIGWRMFFDSTGVRHDQ